MAITMAKIGEHTNAPVLELRGLSSDIKPTDFVDGAQVINGSVFIEIDTGKGFLFDEQNKKWEEV